MAELVNSLLTALGVALAADLNALELVLLAAAALFLARRRGRPHGLERWLRRLAWPRSRAVLIVGASAVLFRLALLPVLPPPHPVRSDEFSHLLLGETLALGRAANPAHPLWEHFETRHVLQQPSYASMYMPGQGVFLAAGKLLAGHAWAGVLLSSALMSAAICWMLQGWLPPVWAFVGAMLAVLRLGLVSYWVNSFWGGAVGALGGALVLGALPRLASGPGWAAGAWLGLGVVAMANSRPFEGLVLCLMAAARLLPLWRKIWRPLALAGLVAGLGGAATAWYCLQVTGSAIRLPYQVNQATYGWPMTLAWHDPARIEHRHQSLRDYYQWELEEHARIFRPAEWPLRGVVLWSFFFGPALTLPALLLPGILRQRRIRFLALASLGMLGAAMLEQSTYPHYLSPATGAIFGLAAQGIRLLRVRRPQLAWGIPAVCLAAVCARLILAPLGAPLRAPQRELSWCCVTPREEDRYPYERRLASLGGRHLVLVRYDPRVHVRLEWVYNSPDIDSAAIVWARELGPQADGALLAHFGGRQVWLAEPDARPPRLTPLPQTLSGTVYGAR